jgi:hypothetical protein
MGSIVHQTTGTLPIAFPRTTIQTKPSQLAFHANISLEAMTGIVVYFKDYELGFAMLCCLTFLYSGCSKAFIEEDLTRARQSGCHIRYSLFAFITLNAMALDIGLLD